MIVQHLCRGGLRVIPQHEHALVSGAFAQAWRKELGFDLVMAVAMHDFPWVEEDHRVHLTDDNTLMDFIHYPVDERLELYRRGVDKLETISPYSALTASLHYLTLMRQRATATYIHYEEARQRRLMTSPGLQAKNFKTALGYIRFFDALSLFLCMMAPEVVEEGKPSWLAPAVWAQAPGEEVLTLSWETPTCLRLSPSPLRQSLHFSIPCKHLPQTHFTTVKEAQQAFDDAPRDVWQVSVV